LTPSKTLQIAQSLYLAGLISYPRTSSQKLPASIGYKEILKKLAKEYDVEKLITKNKPIEGKNQTLLTLQFTQQGTNKFYLEMKKKYTI